MKKRLDKYGICFLTTIPVYRQSGIRAELISELLFGESYRTLFEEDGWIYIVSNYDQFEGWIDHRQFHEISKEECDRCESIFSVTLSPLEAISSNEYKRFISMGSSLPKFDGLSFKLDNTRFNYSGDIVPDLSDTDLNLLITNISKKLLYVPERRGGRSILGMDTDGFVQFVYKILGIKLPRKAQHQARKGKIVHFVDDARVGDVAYFANPKNRRIFHTGIIINDKKIIHVNGYVRIDDIDHIGIYNHELKRYTHQLRTIRRYF